MNTVRFTIQRKSSLSGIILTFPIHINGRYADLIRNGKRISAEAPKSAVYFIEDHPFSDKNAVLYDNGQSDYHVLMKRAGGWTTASYNTFYVEQNGKLAQAPSFHLDKLHRAIYSREISGLSPDEQVLTLCLALNDGIQSYFDEAFAAQNPSSMIEALETIGAGQSARLLRAALAPDGHPAQQTPDSLKKAADAVWKNKEAYAEYHEAFIRFMLAKLPHADYVF